MGNPVVHFEIRAEDPDAAREFYGKLFGWTFPAGGIPGYTYVETGVPDAIPGGIGPTQGGSDLVTVFMGVEDVEASLKEAERLGGTIVQPADQGPRRHVRALRGPCGARGRRRGARLRREARRGGAAHRPLRRALRDRRRRSRCSTCC